MKSRTTQSILGSLMLWLELAQSIRGVKGTWLGKKTCAWNPWENLMVTSSKLLDPNQLGRCNAHDYNWQATRF